MAKIKYFAGEKELSGVYQKGRNSFFECSCGGKNHGRGSSIICEAA